MRDVKHQGSLGGFLDWSSDFEANASGLRWLRSNGSNVQGLPHFIMTAASNTKYQCLEVTYQVLIPKYYMSFFCCSSFTVSHIPMRDSDDVHSTVLNAVGLVYTGSGESLSFATSPKSAIRVSHSAMPH